MKDALDFTPALAFLTQLGKNNSKKWFEANRSEYEAVMDTFGSFVGWLITEIGRVEDLAGVTPKDCILRIYRDVRFSKDKSPYKTNLGAEIVSGGRKSGRLGYHISIAPDGRSMIAGGLYEPTPQQISRFRETVSRDAAPFKKILRSSPYKRHFGSLWGNSLKTVPKGYSADHPEIELLRRTQICAMQSLSDGEVASAKLPRLVLEGMRAMKPFIDYLNALIS